MTNEMGNISCISTGDNIQILYLKEQNRWKNPMGYYKIIKAKTSDKTTIIIPKIQESFSTLNNVMVITEDPYSDDDDEKEIVKKHTIEFDDWIVFHSDNTVEDYETVIKAIAYTMYICGGPYLFLTQYRPDISEENIHELSRSIFKDIEPPETCISVSYKKTSNFGKLALKFCAVCLNALAPGRHHSTVHYPKSLRLYGIFTDNTTKCLYTCEDCFNIIDDLDDDVDDNM
jgi:hypothetical protein